MPVQPEEQVTDRSPGPVCQPPSAQVLRPIVQQVAPLAERREIAWLIVRRIVVQVRCREDDARGAPLISWPSRPTPDQPPFPAPPSLSLFIPPAPIAKVTDGLPMRPAAMLASPVGAPEPDGLG